MVVMIADIGGTHARFALADASGVLQEPVVLSTRDMTTAPELVRAAMREIDTRPDHICLAVAGPVHDGRAKITNQGAVFDEAELTKAEGLSVRLVNDFVALAHGTTSFRSLHPIGSGSADGGVKALLGPGSGLGMAILIPEAGGYRVQPSEGGHADLAVTSHLEAELWGALSRRVSHVCWEAVLSGPGLVTLHAALSEVWGVEAKTMTAAEISAAGLSVDDPICHQTLELFFGFLGTAAGNLAVTTLATGGVYIGGGIVPRMVEFAASSPFRRRFEERGMMTDVIRNIPVWVVMDANPGLVGAARYAARHGFR
jgi:glucokinase